MRHLAFDTSHAGVPVTYFAGTIALALFALQPVYVALSLAGAFAYSLACRGLRETLLKLRWQLPMIAVVGLANPLFSAQGATVAWRLGPVAVYWESVAFGLTMGALLAASILWFENAAATLPADRVLALLGARLPVVSTMVVMVAQLVPQLLRRGRTAGSALDACTAASAPAPTPVSRAARLSGVVMSWAMEDSLERSDAMRARGWGATRRRTSYRGRRLTTADAALLALVALLLALNVALVAVACSQWHFYPTMARLVPWWGYVPYAILMLVPTALALADDISWRLTK
ncbi:MAG: energy-coupling factor transporter transmembrane protein EcfT [Olsenella sp.]|nr:energy-coupling factor transporter transmembrane protein EcfT [Olsenella sp.]